MKAEPTRCLSCGQPPPSVRDTIPLICGLCWYCRHGLKSPPSPKKEPKSGEAK